MSTTRAERAPFYIVVPGGGIDERGKPLPHVISRLDRAADLFQEYREHHREPPVVLCLSQGTTHLPNPKGSDGYAITEAAASVRYLAERRDVPPSSLREESFSWDTVGNAYFARALFMEPAGVTEAVVITNAWHMDRTEAIFKFVFGLPPFMPSQNGALRTKESLTLHFDAVADALPVNSLAARRRHEEDSLKIWRGNMANVKTLRDLEVWLFTDHNAYSVQRHFRDWRAKISSDTAKSYGVTPGQGRTL
mmetsp:Transcript_10747/g.32609  ORF Transcript_10747/g.32609 Transcript_10747/m.32609 type:complete len:250 (-) Transcript_10747:162-911(-)